MLQALTVNLTVMAYNAVYEYRCIRHLVEGKFGPSSRLESLKSHRASQTPLQELQEPTLQELYFTLS